MFVFEEDFFEHDTDSAYCVDQTHDEAPLNTIIFRNLFDVCDVLWFTLTTCLVSVSVLLNLTSIQPSA